MIMCFTVPEIWHVTDAIVIFHFGFFCLFSPLTARKIKISKKWKKNQHLEISSFNTCVPKIMICFTVPEIWCVTDILLFFILGYFLPFCPLTAQKNQNFNFKKMKKNPGCIIILHKCTKNNGVRQMGGHTYGRTDGQTDGKSNIQVGAPPKNR